MDKYWPNHLAALAEANQPEAAFRSLEKIAAEHVGAPLFTVMLHDFAAGRARRVFSNRADVYPVGGWKQIQKNRYSQSVIDRREPFINHTIEDIRGVFSDHETIQQLGCESSCHVPLVIADTLLGVVNMLNVSGYFTEERLQRAIELRPFAIGPIFLARKQLGVW